LFCKFKKILGNGDKKMNKVYKITLAAVLAVAITLTFNACGGNATFVDDTGNSSSSLYSSSSENGSSSSGGSSSSNGSSSSIASSSSGTASPYTDKGNSISSYGTIEIGGKTWMTENLNYKVAGSKCYGEGNPLYNASEVQSNCDKYGRLYGWATVMGFDASCNTSTCEEQVSEGHRGICPSGWHIPSKEDWDKLMRYVDGDEGTISPYNSSTAGKHLKATSGWNDYNGNSGNGEDTHDFSALPGGYGNSSGTFSNVGNNGYWWSSSEYDKYRAYSRSMIYNGENATSYTSDKSLLLSVRCVKD
jgi:uncharacterized protein (TIGR02145 family)